MFKQFRLQKSADAACTHKHKHTLADTSKDIQFDS